MKFVIIAAIIAMTLASTPVVAKRRVTVYGSAVAGSASVAHNLAKARFALNCQHRYRGTASGNAQVGVRRTNGGFTAVAGGVCQVR